MLLVVSLAMLSACRFTPGGGAPTLQPTPQVTYSQPELAYRLIVSYSDLFYCDPDFYPVARPGQEEKNALEQFPAIRADSAEFSAIVDHLKLAGKVDYIDQEKLQIYREHKKLKFGLQMTASGDGYDFVLRVGQGQGQRIEGRVSRSGEVSESKREPSFNTCPICLAKGALIDSPGGPIAVEDLRQGMPVWTVDGSGKRAAGVVVEIGRTPVPAGFRMARITLADGRTVTASPGHPTGEGKALGSYRIGEVLDGGVVVAVEAVQYDDGTTYDLLPSGATGSYWANGILLRSTLTGNSKT